MESEKYKKYLKWRESFGIIGAAALPTAEEIGRLLLNGMKEESQQTMGMSEAVALSSAEKKHQLCKKISPIKVESSNIQ